MRDMIGELWIHAPHRNYFPIKHFVLTNIHNSKTTGRMWTFYTSSNCSTIEDVYFFVLELDASYK